ncbi:MAG: four helix bundle protein [Chthoniobacteraceae bacterium]
MKDGEIDLKDRTKRFALRVIRMFTRLPKAEVARILGRQVLRSGTSVGANYREADEGRSKAEFISKMGDSLRELSETEYWLELLVESETATPKSMAPLLQETRELKLIFATIIRKARGGGEK